eukprot:SAG31_NODE_4833_length_2919_cov_2.040426_1_plen_89_part_00
MTVYLSSNFAGTLNIFTSPDGAHWDTQPVKTYDMEQKTAVADAIGSGTSPRWQTTTEPISFPGLFLKVTLKPEPRSAITAADVVATLI